MLIAIYIFSGLTVLFLIMTIMGITSRNKYVKGLPKGSEISSLDDDAKREIAMKLMRSKSSIKLNAAIAGFTLGVLSTLSLIRLTGSVWEGLILGFVFMLVLNGIGAMASNKGKPVIPQKTE